MLPRPAPWGQDPNMKRGHQRRSRPLLVSRQFLTLLPPILQVKKQMQGVQLQGFICQLGQGLRLLDGAGIGYEEPASIWTRRYLTGFLATVLPVIAFQADLAA